MINKELMSMVGGGIKPEANLLGEVIIEGNTYLLATPIQGLGYLWDWSYTQFPIMWSQGAFDEPTITFVLPDSPWRPTDGLSYFINIDAGLYLISNNEVNPEPDYGACSFTFRPPNNDKSYFEKFLAQFDENGKKINFWLGSKPDWL